MKWYHWVLKILQVITAIGKKHVEKHDEKN